MIDERPVNDVLETKQSKSIYSEQNVATLREKLKKAGLAEDPDQAVMTTMRAEISGDNRDIFGYKVSQLLTGVGLRVPEEKRAQMLRVESDGTPLGTRVFVGETELKMIQEVSWQVVAGAAIPVVTIKAVLADIKIVSGQDNEEEG